jgi:hypothetical protein
VAKGAFNIGGRYGKGLVAQRNSGWGTRLFIEIAGGSFGSQLEVEATDVVRVFTNRDGIKPLLKGKLKIGADASATAGRVGRKAEAGTDILLKSAICSYSRSKSLFAGIALDGDVIQLDDEANKSVYGKKTVAADISKGKVGGERLRLCNRSFALCRSMLLPKYSRRHVSNRSNDHVMDHLCSFGRLWLLGMVSSLTQWSTEFKRPAAHWFFA